jgi:hypothetical protein
MFENICNTNRYTKSLIFKLYIIKLIGGAI